MGRIPNCSELLDPPPPRDVPRKTTPPSRYPPPPPPPQGASGQQIVGVVGGVLNRGVAIPLCITGVTLQQSHGCRIVI